MVRFCCSLSNTLPSVINYCAVSDPVDTSALVFLLIFSLRQMLRFYTIAIFLFKDCQAASIPVLPCNTRIMVTKYYIILYVIGFMLAMIMLTISCYASYKYLIVASSVSVGWLIMTLLNYKFTNDYKKWARKLFIFSIFVITPIAPAKLNDIIVLYGAPSALPAYHNVW